METEAAAGANGDPAKSVCLQPAQPVRARTLHFFKCSALRSISAARRHQMVVQYIAAFVHRHGGTAVMEPLHIGGDKSKQRVDLRIRIGQLAADGDVHIHNPTSGNNTSLTPFAVGKPAAQRKRDKYQAHSSRDGFKFFSLGADDTGAMDPEFREFAKQLACVCANNNSVLTPGDVLREFASGVARVIHKGNFVIAKTSDLRSMEAQQPVEMESPHWRRVRISLYQDALQQVKQAAQPAARPATPLAAKPAARPKFKPAATPALLPAAQPRAKPAATPAVLPATQPKFKPAVQPRAKPGVLPAVLPAAQPRAKPAARPKDKPTSAPPVAPQAPQSAAEEASNSDRTNSRSHRERRRERRRKRQLERRRERRERRRERQRERRREQRRQLRREQRQERRQTQERRREIQRTNHKAEQGTGGQAKQPGADNSQQPAPANQQRQVVKRAKSQRVIHRRALPQRTDRVFISSHESTSPEEMVSVKSTEARQFLAQTSAVDQLRGQDLEEDGGAWRVTTRNGKHSAAPDRRSPPRGSPERRRSELFHDSELNRRRRQSKLPPPTPESVSSGASRNSSPSVR